MKKILLMPALLLFSACTTPMTTLRHGKTEQVVTCGGSATGSMVGGAIGYHIQKDNDNDCVKNYEKQGFKVIDKTEK
ncbi:MAG: hypothetical protein LW823_08425 [Rickettsiales bacterium]|jgi:hypothetical protein|nr:hypothetical protein [Rickettsiales bacterium]